MSPEKTIADTLCRKPRLSGHIPRLFTGMGPAFYDSNGPHWEMKCKKGAICIALLFVFERPEKKKISPLQKGFSGLRLFSDILTNAPLFRAYFNSCPVGVEVYVCFSAWNPTVLRLNDQTASLYYSFSLSRMPEGKTKPQRHNIKKGEKKNVCVKESKVIFFISFFAPSAPFVEPYSQNWRRFYFVAL